MLNLKVWKARRLYLRATAVNKLGSRRVVSCRYEHSRGYVVQVGELDNFLLYKKQYEAGIYQRFMDARQFCDTMIAGINGQF